MQYKPVFMKVKLRVGQTSICSDSQVAMKALWLPKQCLHWYYSAKKALNISTRHIIGLYWVTGHARVCGNETDDNLKRDNSTQKFV
jgi:ribonuclease HI